MFISEIFSEFRLFLSAGSDTTSNSMKFGLIHLAKSKELQDVLYQELISVLKDKNNINLHENLSKLHLFRAFIRESLRLSHIAVGGVPRKMKQSLSVKMYDNILNKDIDIIIPKNSIVSPNIAYANTHSPYWSSYTKTNPNNPYGGLNLDAWLQSDSNGNKSFKINPNFVTFSVGKRNCIGMTLAIKEMQCFFAYIIMNYQLSWNYNTKINDRWAVIRTINPEIGMSISKRFN